MYKSIVHLKILVMRFRYQSLWAASSVVLSQVISTPRMDEVNQVSPVTATFHVNRLSWSDIRRARTIML